MMTCTFGSYADTFATGAVVGFLFGLASMLFMWYATSSRRSRNAGGGGR